MVYQWKDGRSFGVKAQIAGETLATIRQANGGHLTPEAVVEASRDENAPLHPCFEWDAIAAQEKYNKHIARNVIHSVVEIYTAEDDGTQQKVLSYVHVKTPETGNCYMTTAHVMSDSDLREQALNEALKYLAGAQARFAHLDELSDVFTAIDRATKRMAKRHRATNQPQVAAAS